MSGSHLSSLQCHWRFAHYTTRHSTRITIRIAALRALVKRRWVLLYQREEAGGIAAARDIHQADGRAARADVFVGRVAAGAIRVVEIPAAGRGVQVGGAYQVVEFAGLVAPLEVIVPRARRVAWVVGLSGVVELAVSLAALILCAFSLCSEVVETIWENLFPNTIDPRRGADEETFAGDGGGGHAHVVFGELVGVEEFEALPGFADIGAAVFVEAEDFSLVGPG